MNAPRTQLGAATGHSSLARPRARFDNPFPGLRSFRPEEDYLFFGRENQVNTMVDKLSKTRFLAVVGSSGSGKSSLVSCGLCPALHRGLMAKAGTSWRIAYFRPGSDPIRAMARALAEDGVLFKGFEADVMSLDQMLEATLRMSKLGLVDIYEQAQGDDRNNLLVIVDQFEELFRFRSLALASNKQDRTADTVAFINLLLEAADQSDLPIYVVLTMRSDFLGDCAQLNGLPEAINEGQYLVPRMTREELRAAITGPVGVGGAEISPVLLTRLVNDAGDNSDQLSILQHALNRTWARWQHDGKSEGPLTLAQYEAIGGMSNALDKHAEKAFAELEGEHSKKIAEKIFKALTDKGTDARGIRRPTKFSGLCALAGARPDEVAHVINVFRKPSRSFLMPPRDEDLEPDTVVDISHESLMRVWARLRSWVEQEAESATRYRRLAESAELHVRGAAGLMTEPELSITLAWQHGTLPNAAWAERYCPGFDRAAAFLDQSRSERDTAQQAAELRTRREQWRRRWISVAILSSLVFGGYAWLADSAREDAEKALADVKRAQHEKEDAQRATLAVLEEKAAIEAVAKAKAESVARSAKTRADAQSAQATLAGLKHSLQDLERAVFKANHSADHAALAVAREKLADRQQQISNAETRAKRLAKIADDTLAEASAILGDVAIIPLNSIRRFDLLDVGQSTRVTKTSGVGTPAENMFGLATGSPELGISVDKSGSGWNVTFFADGQPADYVHSVELRTKTAVSLESIGLFARHDDIVDGYEFRRAFSQFRLYARKNSDWIQIADYSPTLPYGGGDSRTALAVCLAVTPITADEFRAEFVQAVDILGQFSGPRLVGLDGNSLKCGDQYPKGIAGTWHGSSGSAQIVQNGTNLTVEKGGRVHASGSIHGDKVDVAFQDDLGCCKGTVSSDGRTISWSDATTWIRSL
jgi:energy-coupling factor transporter ATP-binding protein EcfA2